MSLRAFWVINGDKDDILSISEKKGLAKLWINSIWGKLRKSTTGRNKKSLRTSLNFVCTGCPRRNVPDFGRVFLMLKYTDITQNTYVQSWTVTEIMAKERCGLLAGPRTVPVSWQSYQCPSLSVASYDGNSTSSRYVVECAVSHVTSLSCIVLGTLRTTMTRVRVFL
jgi:hypothetical protein